MDLFLTNTTIHFTNEWTVVILWIIVRFLSAVWTLPLAVPIHFRGSIDEQVI